MFWIAPSLNASILRAQLCGRNNDFERTLFWSTSQYDAGNYSATLLLGALFGPYVKAMRPI